VQRYPARKVHLQNVYLMGKLTECLFQVEPEFAPFVPAVDCHEVLQPNWLSSVIGIDFEADLALKSMTNTYGIKVSYFDHDNRVIVPDTHPYIVFNPLGQNNPHLFISHKDPEDTMPCRRLRDFLKKVGFEGYLSEDDHRPGVDLWTGKIPSAIEGSRGVVILWTEHAARNPNNIYREIDLAKGLSKPLILASESGLDIPDRLSKAVEYHHLEHPVAIADLKKLAAGIYNAYRNGDYG
jgi:hypothetical protein